MAQRINGKQRGGIAFRARRTTSFVTGTNVQTTGFNFDSIDYNYGSGYNATTGDFTAPVNGVYTFCGTWDLEGVGSMVRGFVVPRGTVPIQFRPRPVDFSTTPNQSRLNWVLEIPMVAGETIGFDVWTSSATNLGRGTTETWVAGHLIMAT